MKPIKIVEPEVGWTVLFSLVYEDTKGNIVRNEQHFGTIHSQVTPNPMPGECDEECIICQ